MDIVVKRIWLEVFLKVTGFLYWIPTDSTWA